MVLAIVEVEPARGHFGRRIRQRHRGNGPAGAAHRNGDLTHFAALSAPSTRAPMLSASTVSVISKAPLQASCFQYSYGLCTKLLMVTGRLAMALPRARLKNCLLSVVNIS